MHWSATLGPIETDYRNLTMTFIKNGVNYKLQRRIATSLEVLAEKEIKSVNSMGFLLQIKRVE